MNGPTTFALAPGEKRGFPINLNDGWWKRDQTNSHLKDNPLLVRVNYHANPAGADLFPFLTDSTLPDWTRKNFERWASELAGVFTGSAVSDWVPSQPPHDWLFVPIPYPGETVAQLMQHSPEEVLRRICDLIDQWACEIKFDAKEINEAPTASLAALEEMRIGATVGHLVHSILEDSENIQQTVSEARAYLKARYGTQTDDRSEAASQGHDF
jgi:hypothetical protein